MKSGVLIERHARSLWLGLTSACVLALLVVSAADAKPGSPLHKKTLDLYASATSAPACFAAADELLKIMQAPDADDYDKCNAACYRIQTLDRASRQCGDPTGMDKALEAYKEYKATFWGKNRDCDRSVAWAYMYLQNLYLRRGKKENLEEAVRAVDAMKEFADAKTYNQGPVAYDLFRAQSYQLVGQHDTALQMYQKYLTDHGEAARADAYDALAISYQTTGRNKEAITALADAANRYGDGFKVSGIMEMKLLRDASIGTNAFSEEELQSLVPKVLANSAMTDAVLGWLTQKKLGPGDFAGAIGYARMAYSVSPIDRADAPIAAIAQCLRSVDMDISKANLFLRYQQYGAAGPDGKPGTEDDLTNPMGDMARPLSPATMKLLEKKLSETLPEKGNVYERMRDRGTIYLALGKCKEALRSYVSAYNAASLTQVREASGLVPRALKAKDGTIFRANQYLAYQQTGPAGKDGVLGNEDDLADPLAGEDLPPLAPEVEKALRGIAATDGRDLPAREVRGYALLALADFKGAFSEMRSGYMAAGSSEKSLARAVQNVAAAIKAYDGHVKRANDYLQFQTYGAVGPDGKGGKPLVNPLPEILKKLGV